MATSTLSSVSFTGSGIRLGRRHAAGASRGEKAFSDFTGSTLPVTNPHTGEVTQAHVFVCALGASSCTYAEAFWSENSEAWCTGHANAFKYFGGAVPSVSMINQKQIEAVTALPGPKRYDHFIKVVAAWEEVWGLYQNGWALAATNDENQAVFPVWPDTQR